MGSIPGEPRRRLTVPHLACHVIPGFGQVELPCSPDAESALIVLTGAGKVLTDAEPYHFVGPCTLVLGQADGCTVVNQGVTVMEAVMVIGRPRPEPAP